MKISSTFWVVSLVILLAACGEKQPAQETTLTPQAAFDSLITYIESNGNFINSDLVPAMISAGELYQQLDSNILIIDTRTPSEFSEAHIPTSVNVPFNLLLTYFESKIDPNSFTKIVLVCNSGQTLSYAASILRILGYNNVFTLKWGISSWHRPIAESRWISRVSNKYSELLETSSNVKNPAGEFPGIETQEKYGYNILRERAQKLFAEGYNPFTLTADTLFEARQNFYIVNYWPMDLYNAGHIPGAIQYQPKKSLHSKEQLNTLPTDKPIAVYCYTGQHSSFAVAYLRLLGYDARTVSFGANGFMQGVMVKENMHSIFTIDEILNLPISTGGVAQPQKETEVIVTQPRGGC
jgi:rhodanese-related sulfurtransferase